MYVCRPYFDFFHEESVLLRFDTGPSFPHYFAIWHRRGEGVVFDPSWMRFNESRTHLAQQCQTDEVEIWRLPQQCSCWCVLLAECCVLAFAGSVVCGAMIVLS